jgi:hypothetical protein
MVHSLKGNVEIKLFVAFFRKTKLCWDMNRQRCYHHEHTSENSISFLFAVFQESKIV